MIKNKGNFKRTVGVYEMKLQNGIEIDFVDGINGEDLFSFGEVLQLNEKEKTKGMAKFIIEFLDKQSQFTETDEHGKETTWSDNDKSKFVVQNLVPFIREFMIMFEVTDAETFDKVIKEAEEKAKREADGKESPSEKAK